MRNHIRNIFTWVIVTLLFCMELFGVVIYADPPFEPNVRVNELVSIPSSGTQDAPSSAVDDAGNIYIAWIDYRNEDPDIYFTKSLDGGNTFSTNKRVNDDVGDAMQYSPSIAVDGVGNIYIARIDHRDGLAGDIYFANSTDGGNTFSANKKVNDESISDPVGDALQYNPSLAVDDAGFIYLVWVDERNRNPDIYFAKSTDGGNTFSTNKKVNDDPGRIVGQYAPSIAIDGAGKIYIVWMDERKIDNPYKIDNPDIYFARSTDGGNTFSTNKKINDDFGTSEQIYPCIVTTGINKIYIVWTDLRNGDRDIYFTKSLDSGYNFLSNRKVNDDVVNATQDKPSIAVESPSIIYITWMDNRNGNYDIYFAKSTDGGNTFSVNKKVNDDVGNEGQYEPSMIVDNSGIIYIAWTDNRNGNYNIFFAKSTNGGNTFSANKRVDDDDIADAGQYEPSLAVDSGGNIYIAWMDNRNGNYDIYFTKSTDGGNTFSADKKINDDVGSAYQSSPSIAVDGAGNIYITWRDNRNSDSDIYFANSMNGGNTFSGNKRVIDDVSGAHQTAPSIAVDSASNIYIVWEDKRNGNYDIYFAKSTNGGNTFSVNKKVNDDSGNEKQRNPSIAIEGMGNIYIVWTDMRNGDSDIYFTCSNDGGNSFSFNKRVNDDVVNAKQNEPSVALDGTGNIFIAWEDKRNGHSDIYFARSSNQGNTFSSNKKINDDAGYEEQLAPAIVAYGFGYIHVVWGDKRNGDSDIYYANSTNGGNTFSDNKRVNDDVSAAQQIAPSIASDSEGNIFVAWEDKRNVRSDIYFSKTELIPTLIITEIQDSPDVNEWVEVYNPTPVAVNLLDMKISLDLGMTFIDGSWSKSVVDLGEYSVWTPIVIGVLNNEGATISIHNYTDLAKPVLAVVGYGQDGTTPDPLISESAARYWDNTLSIYEDSWSRNGSTGPTPGAVNNGPGANPVPSVILNEIYFYPFSPQNGFIELIYIGDSSINIGNYRIVCDTECIVLDGTIIDSFKPFFYLFYGMDNAFFDNMSTSGDNVYLYDANGKLLDMVGWDSPHEIGKTISRVPDGNGTNDGYDDVSSVAAGWRFNCTPTVQLVKIDTPDNKQFGNFGHFGSYLVFNMTVYNFQKIDDIINILDSSQEGWTVGIFDETGMIEIENISVNAGSCANFTVNVTLPSSIPFAVMDNITIEIRSSNSAIIGDSIVLNVRVYPFLNLTKNANPNQIYLNGTGHDEITTITLNMTGMGAHSVRDYLDVVFCIDSSYSMWDNDFYDWRKKESQNFIDKHLEMHDRAAVVDFDGKAFLQPYGWPIGDHLSSDFERIKANIEMIDMYPPSKRVSAGLNMSNKELRLYGQPADHIPIIILITDAVSGDENAVINEANISASRGVKIIVIGLMTNGTSSEKVLKDVANITGGLYFEAPDASYFKYIFENISAYLDMAVGDIDTTDSNPMVRDVLPWYIDYIPGSFSIQPDNIYKDFMTGENIIEWNIPWIKLNQTWSVSFDVKANLPGLQETNVYNKSRAFYTRGDNTTDTVLFPRCWVDVLPPAPQPPKLYIDILPNSNDILLYWDQQLSLATDHYLIYRATSPTGFDFSSPWVDTSDAVANGIDPGDGLVIPSRRTWNHTGAADPNDPLEYSEQWYYCIRAVNSLSEISYTSRTVGKWTKEYTQGGVSTFSLPLEPLETITPTADYYLNDMNANYIRWMNQTTHTWMKHGGGFINDTTLKLGKGYEVEFMSPTKYTFLGMPGSMIRYNSVSFVGFDYSTEADSLKATVPDPVTGDIKLYWTQPSDLNVVNYNVYRSTTRNGFDDGLAILLDTIPVGNESYTDFGAAVSEGHYYYMIVPLNITNVEGASTYSIGIWTEEYLAQYDTFGIPLKLNNYETADWYCAEIPDSVGINYFNFTLQLWFWHSTRMPKGAFDPILVMTEGYQISTSNTTKFTFIGI
ncbi:MAG: exo-alpha-sialidase [Methanomassiliicoccales archaeon]|nr:MAG: exo-alpha-sialidase [Methanomassiliicoccales archaeon]